LIVIVVAIVVFNIPFLFYVALFQGQILILPDSISGRQQILNDANVLLKQWIERANALAPDHLTHALQRYLRQKKNNNNNNDNVRTGNAALLFGAVETISGLTYKSRAEGVVCAIESVVCAGDERDNACVSQLLIDELRNHQESFETVCDLTAWIVRKARGDDINVLGRLLVQDWSLSCATTAIWCWRWVLSEQPDHCNNLLMHTVFDCVRISFERKWGIFASHLVPPASPEVDPYGLDALESVHSDPIAVHNALFEFLLQRMRVIHGCSDEAYQMMQLVGECLHVPLCILSTTLGARFSLYQLALELLHAVVSINIIDSNALLTSVINGALEWFALPPSIYIGSDWNSVIATLESVLRLSHSALANSTSDVQGVLSPRLNLLRLLILQQAANIAIYHDPLNVTHSSLRDPLANYTGSLDALVQVAWSVTPRLALQLPLRVPATKSAIVRLIDAAPLQVIHLGEAVKLFVTREKIQSNDPVLRYLGQWERNGIDAATAVQVKNKTFLVCLCFF
jgi:hypothetical protein